MSKPKKRVDVDVLYRDDDDHENDDDDEEDNKTNEMKRSDGENQYLPVKVHFRHSTLMRK